MSFPPTPTQSGLLNGFGTAVPSTGLTATTDAHSLIEVKITSQLATGNSVSVTDNIGNVYLMSPLSAPGASQRHQEIWYCLDAAPGVTAVTVNNTASTNVAGTVEVWAGGSSGLRTQGSVANSSSGTPTAALATPVPGDLMVSTFGYQATTASTRQETIVSGSGFTALTPVTRGTTTMQASAYKIATAATSQGPAYTLSPATSSGAAIAVFIPMAPVNVAPVAGAGSDRTIEAGAPFALAGTDSDSDGTISTRGWTQTPSSTVTLTGSGANRTGIGPVTLNGVALTFVYSVTDDDGATTTDTVVITVLPAARRMKIGGIIVPCLQRAKLPSGSFLVTDNGDGTYSGTGEISETNGLITSSSGLLTEDAGMITYQSA